MKAKVSEKSAKAYVEILELIKYMEPECINKIPQGLIKFFEEHKDRKHNYKFDKEKAFSEQKISEETGGLLAMIALNYIADENEKNVIKEILVKNEEIYQNELSEKYNSNVMFENRNSKKENKVEEKSLVIIREKLWYQKIFNKIKEIFRRKI